MACLILCIYHKHHKNQRLLDATAHASQNLNSAVHRLQARGAQLTSHPSAALASLQSDFDSALAWLNSNDEALKSSWTALEAAKQLQDLDERLTMAFARKMPLAILETVQEDCALGDQLSVQIEQLDSNTPKFIEQIVASSSTQGIERTLTALREEERLARPSQNGFADQEAEKVISSLIDTITRLQENTAQPQSPARSESSITPQKQLSEKANDAFSSDSIRDMQTAVSQASNPQAPPSPPTSSSTSNLSGTEPSPVSTTSSTSLDSSRQPAFSRTSAGPSASAPQETSAIGFMPIDAKTKRPLVDPVLCADGSIRDRFEVISQAEAALVRKGTVATTAFPALKERKRELAQQIIGDILTLRLAIWDSFPTRREQCFAQRQSYKEHALTLCGPEGHSQLARALFAVSHALAYEPEETSAPLLIRRAVLNYRVRNLDAAEQDLSRAIDVSARGNRRNVDPDARRYRAWVRYTCQDRDGALADIQEMLRRVRDPLAIALRASITAGDGNVDAAIDDLDHLESALIKFEDWASDIARQNMDLIYIAKGWALMSVGRYSEAIGEFNTALEHRLTVDPYVLAAKALAQVISGDVISGNTTMDKALNYAESLAPQQSSSSMAPASAASTSALAESPISPVTPFSATALIPTSMATWTQSSFYDVYLLKGMGAYIEQDYESALEAFERAATLRPRCVKETGESRYMLACVRARLGQTEQARNDFDWAAALKPSQADFYHYESANLCSNLLDQVD